MQIVKFLTDADDAEYSVVEASDGEEALAKMNDDISIAIVDIRMEPMGGFDFIRALRGEDIHTPVILVTGDNNPDLLSDANKLDVAAVLMKPVQRDRLLKTVSRTLQIKSRSSQ